MATGTQQPRVVPSYNPNERIVLMQWSSAQYGDTTYYADKLPCEIKWYKILSVLAAIFTTPVALLCLIPTVNYMEKARDRVESGDISGARQVYMKSFWCRLLGWLWIGLFLPIVVTGVIVGIALAVAG